MLKFKSPLVLPTALVAAVASGLTLILSNLSFFSFIELKGLDLLFTLRGPLSPPSQIIIVAIDEPSMAEIERQWPWPRSLHAQLIRQLNKAGAKVIGFDILFAESSEPTEDQALAQALQETGNVVLGSEFAVVNDPAFRHTIQIDPIPAFRDAATVGNPLVSIDADGIVRRAWLSSLDRPSFALQIVNRYQRNPPSGIITIKLNELNQKGLSNDVLINYRGPPRTVKTVSYYQALDYEHMLPPGIFGGKIVLVGRSLEAMPEPQRLSSDTFLTPFSWIAESPTSGVEIQATIVSNLLEGNFVTTLSKPAQHISLILLASAASFLFVRLKPIIALTATAILVGLLLLTGFIIFTKANFWLPIVSGIVALMLVYGGHLLSRVLMVERERRFMLEELNRNLEAQIAKRTRDLATANQELYQRHQQLEVTYQDLAHTQEQLIQSAKMASLGLLVAGVAHELNNPISFVCSNLEFIEEYTERFASIIEAYESTDLPETPSRRRGDLRSKTAKFSTTLNTLRELIASCKEGTDRVKKIVVDLRAFSRTDDIGLVWADLNEGIESTLTLLTKEYKDRITIHRDYGNLPKIECHPGQINQVIMNLLQNAVQAITNKGDVWIKTELNGAQAKIVIRDNGAGITEEHLAKIFDPFFTTKPVGTGTGLGLSIAYGIIEKHEGKISVTSTVNEGTEFIVELPVCKTQKTT
ncbi:MAG: CHASE2 domain-containing protein [Candidatus Competibacteraceae bacterium]